jgi:16S rRNA (cytidine1402-2'-O)-methyltransferase
LQVRKSFEDERQGKLYLVGTPIGNLEDMTYRAVRTLREVDLIAAEDTRQTRKLLNAYDIAGRLVSHHEHNSRASGTELVRRMLQGESVALVSDAGLPAISDPGAKLVRLAVDAGIAVIPIPGANAGLSALIASGLPTDSFLFVGFLPRANKALRERLERLRNADATLLLYEAPHRLIKTLEELRDAWGDRSLVLARELTKKFEEFARGTITECLVWLKDHPPIGEYCLVVEGCTQQTEEQSDSRANLPLAEHVAALVAGEGLDRKEAMRKAAQERGISRREVYNQLVGQKDPLTDNDRTGG